MKKTNNTDNEFLYQAFLTLKTKKNVINFLRDILTQKEIKEIAKRLKIAKMLTLRKGSYQEIAKTVKTSTTTVTRVARFLNHGFNGYKTVLKRVK